MFRLYIYALCHGNFLLAESWLIFHLDHILLILKVLEYNIIFLVSILQLWAGNWKSADPLSPEWVILQNVSKNTICFGRENSAHACERQEAAESADRKKAARR